MNLLEAVRVAWMALMTHKLRALLTAVGIIIGVGSVIGMQAIGTGFQNYMAGEFARLGVGVVYITPSISGENFDAGVTPRLTAADAEAIMRPGAVSGVSRVAIEYGSAGVVGSGRARYYYNIHGVTPSYFAINAQDLMAGRFFSDQEDQQQERVVVIGKTAAQQLFGSAQAALGQRVMVEGVGFDIVGILATRPNQMTGGSFNDPSQELFIPYRTARNRLFRNQMTPERDVERISVQAASADRAQDVIRQVTLLLRDRHRLTSQPNDFTVQSVEQMAEQAQMAMGGFSMFLVVIGGISLLIGGIGIMNIMLVSVTQRTREIGLRKAVGARRRDIMLQFLIEAVVLSLAGGTIGVGLGYLLSFAGTFVMRAVFLVPDASAVVTLPSIMMATGVAALIGIVFGFFPALRASRLQPVRALRTE